MLLASRSTPGSLRQRTRSGAAAVEFAFVATAFFILLFGIIDFGRAFMVESMLNQAALRGCRAAILPGSANAKVKTVVNNFCTSINIPNNDPTTSPSDVSTASQGTTITVTVTADMSKVTWMPSIVFSWTTNGTLTGICSMQHE